MNATINPYPDIDPGKKASYNLIVMDTHQIAKHIAVDPQTRFGKPVIKGTRVPVDLVIGKIAGGMTIKEVAQEYELTDTQVRAALQYAAMLVRLEEFIRV